MQTCVNNYISCLSPAPLPDCVLGHRDEPHHREQGGMLDGLFKLSSHLHHRHPHDPGTGSQPVVPDQHYEGCGDQVEDPVQPV